MLRDGIHEVHDSDKSNVEATGSFRYKDEFQGLDSMGANLDINGTFFYCLIDIFNEIIIDLCEVVTVLRDSVHIYPTFPPG